MKKDKNIRKDAKLLVEHILEKDPISANSVFQRLILEAEEAREEEVIEELDLDADDIDTDEEADVEETEIGNDSIEGLDSEEADRIVDDVVEINCQINAKLISILFDKIANIRTAIQELGLDPESREYIKYDETINYYSDKLQDLQNKTNPGVDQSKVSSAVDKLKSRLEELSSDIGIVDSDDFIDDIASPEEIAAENNLEDETETSIEDELAEETDAEEEADETEESDELVDKKVEEDDANGDEDKDDTDDSEPSQEEIEELFK